MTGEGDERNEWLIPADAASPGGREATLSDPAFVRLYNQAKTTQQCPIGTTLEEYDLRLQTSENAGHPDIPGSFPKLLEHTGPTVGWEGMSLGVSRVRGDVQIVDETPVSTKDHQKARIIT